MLGMSVKLQAQSSADPDVRKEGGLPLAAHGKWARMLRQVTLFGLRAGATGSKFLLAVYTARYLSLSDLGIYGLLVAGTNIVPAVTGLGLTDWIVRRIVDAPTGQAIALIASRSALTILLHIVGVPLVLLGFAAVGQPLPLSLALLGAAVLLMETVANQIGDTLIARRRIFLSHWLGFLRQGFWPIPVIAMGMLVPQARTLDMLLRVWCAALSVNWLILFGLLLHNGRWRYVRLEVQQLPTALRGSFLLYIKDISGTFSAFADRFLISVFLGLELSGVYSLFWSVANVVHSLVVIGMLQTHIAPLISAAKDATGRKFRALERRLQVEATAWALTFGGGLAVMMPLFVPYLQRPQMQHYLPVLWLIMVATILRIGADGYAFAIYAFHRDRDIALIAVSGAIASAVLNVVLTPTAGLWGSAIAYVLTASGLLAARFLVCRAAVRGVHSRA
jgi:O-antigen/teichoic acid export membrane protein